MSKGSNRRPQLVSHEQVTDNWGLAFKKYKCGWCGQPCNSDGTVIEGTFVNYSATEKVNGHCCSGKQYE